MPAVEYNIEQIDNGVIIERRTDHISESHMYKQKIELVDDEIFEALSKLRHNNTEYRLIINYEDKRIRKEI